MTSNGHAQPTSTDAPERRLYLRPRPAETTKDMAQRMRDGVLALIAEHRAEVGEDHDSDEADMPEDTS